MKGINRVFLIGHLGKTPKLIFSKSGKPYTRLSLATNRGWSKPGDEHEQKESTDWHSVFVWGNLAELCVAHLQSGALIFVEGTLTYWQVAQDSSAEMDYKNAIHADEVRFLSFGRASLSERLDFSEAPRNHNAVAHPA